MLHHGAALAEVGLSVAHGSRRRWSTRYAFESVNALALGVRRIEIVSGLLLLLAAASNCRNAATALRA
jgi:hypothetical protein